MSDAQVSMTRNRKAVGTIGIVGAGSPLNAILARFNPPDDATLDRDERQSLMDECADRCRLAYRGQPINWPAVDTINAKIGATFVRRGLVALLTD